MTHTPGPWSIEELLGSLAIVSAEGHDVAWVDSLFRKGDRAENEANATLIAAAPTMKKALEKVRDDLSIIVADHKIGKDDAVKRAMKRLNEAIAASRRPDRR